LHQEIRLGEASDAARLRADLSDYMRKHLDSSLASGFRHCTYATDETACDYSNQSGMGSGACAYASAQFLALSKERGLQVKNVKVRSVLNAIQAMRATAVYRR